MMTRSVRVPLAVLTASLAIAGASCESHKQGLPPPPDFAGAQRAVWEHVPKDALGALVIANVGHSLERLRALRTVLSTGPATKSYIDKGMAELLKITDCDPFEEACWRAVGVDPNGPMALVVGAQDSQMILMRTSDREKAMQMVKRMSEHGQAKEPYECAPVGDLLGCSTRSAKFADGAQGSLWSHVENNLPVSHRGMEMLVYAPLDQGQAADAITAAKLPFGGLHAAYFGMTMAPERLIVRLGARIDDTKKLLPYLAAKKGDSLLGLASGSVSAGRMTVSPDALWALAKEKAGEALSRGLGMSQAATGLDLEKDLIENLTGEIVSASYRSEKRVAADGKPLPYMDQLGSALTIGTRDDERTRRVVEKLGTLIGGATGSFAELAKAVGMTPAYRLEPGDRPVHWFSLDFDAERAQALGTNRIEVGLTTIPGALSIVGGTVGLTELKKRIGRKPSAFLDQLPLPEDREMFERSPLVGWGHIGQGFGTRLKLNVATSALTSLSPDAGKAFAELMEVGQLLFDAVAAFDASVDRAELFYQLTFL